MAQLVGQSCSICGERIGNTFESAFCEKCRHPVHNHCRTANHTPETCSACGANLATAARRAEDREQERRNELARLPPPPPLDVERAAHIYRTARWFLGAGAAVMIGIMVIAMDEPGTTFAGVGAIVAGIGMAVLGGMIARR